MLILVSLPKYTNPKFHMLSSSRVLPFLLFIVSLHSPLLSNSYFTFQLCILHMKLNRNPYHLLLTLSQTLSKTSYTKNSPHIYRKQLEQKQVRTHTLLVISLEILDLWTFQTFRMYVFGLRKFLGILLFK